MVEVDGGVTIRVSQESDLNVVAAANVLGSLGVVVVPLASARECYVSVAAPEVGDIDEAAGDTASG